MCRIQYNVLDARFLDPLRLDVPASKIILEYANKALFWVVAVLGTVGRDIVSIDTRMAPPHVPEDEIWVGHEVGDALEHTTGLEYESGEGYFV